MAYPFIQWPTLADFLRVAQAKYNVQIKTVTASKPEQYLLRETDKDKFTAPVPNLNLTDRLDPDLLRSLCGQLDIPLSEFGINMQW
jgi:hypothetical protein